MRLIIRHGSHQYDLDLPSESSIDELRYKIAELTSVPPENQKLLPKPARGVSLGNGSTSDRDENSLRSLQQAGLSDGTSIMVLGATKQQVNQVQEEEREASRWKQPRNFHPSLLKGTRPRSTGTASSKSVRQPFVSLAAHRSLAPSHALYPKVIAYLERLANDEGVIHVCRLHDYSVGQLTELLPWENPELLGLNENRGQIIRLRIRTDDAEGFREYKSVRQVLMHELAHNDIGGHPVEFKKLNSKLNAELAAFERNVAEGTHTLHDGDMYVPAAPGQASQTSNGAGGSYVLGSGSGTAGIEDLSTRPHSSEDRRQAVLQATLRRLAKAEAEIEAACGSATPRQPSQHTS